MPQTPLFGKVARPPSHLTGKTSLPWWQGWWKKVGKKHYPKASKIILTADSGGSNGSRLRLWKGELQQLADEIGLGISVSHFPLGTSKWNTIEHRFFSFISQNWRGEPLQSYKTIVNLISRQGRQVRKMHQPGLTAEPELAPARSKRRPRGGTSSGTAISDVPF